MNIKDKIDGQRTFNRADLIHTELETVLEDSPKTIVIETSLELCKSASDLLFELDNFKNQIKYYLLLGYKFQYVKDSRYVFEL
jgi:hypothetical protein